MSENSPNIWRLQASADIAGLMSALEHDDSEVRRRAAAALRALGAVEALPALLQMRRRETDPLAAAAIVATLEHLLLEQQDTGPARLRSLIERLNSDDPEVLVQTAHILGDLGDKVAVEPLVMVFHNAQMPGYVRLAAAEALVKLESAPAVVTLLAALDSRNAQTRRAAVAMLGQLRADWAVEPIARRLRDEHELVRRTAHAALKRIDTPEARQALDAISSGRPTPGQARAATDRLPPTRRLSPPDDQPAEA